MPARLRVTLCNVRTALDLLHPWKGRRAALAREILSTNPDVVFTQENRKEQAADLVAAFEAATKVRWGRTDAGNVKLIYRLDRVTVVKDWSRDLRSPAGATRHAAFAELLLKASGRSVLVVDTHFTANRIPGARGWQDKQITDILTLVAGYKLADGSTDEAVVIGGDFNNEGFPPPSSKGFGTVRALAARAGFKHLRSEADYKTRVSKESRRCFDGFGTTNKMDARWVCDVLFARAVSLVSGGVLATRNTDHDIIWAELDLAAEVPARVYVVTKAVTSTPRVKGKRAIPRAVGFEISTADRFETVGGVKGVTTDKSHWYPLDSLRVKS